MDWGGRDEDEDLPEGSIPSIWFQVAIAGWMAAAIVGVLKFGDILFSALLN